MFDLKKIVVPIVLAGGIVSAPLAASAVTVTQNGVTNDPFTTIASIDVLSGATFDAVFDNTDVAGFAKFNLNNFSGSLTAVTFVVNTVQQCLEACGFTGGLFYDLNNNGQYEGAPEIYFAENQSGSYTFTFDIVAYGTQYFDVWFGDPYGTSTQKPKFNFTVEAALVPLPAGGLLLMSALGVLGLARRRRSEEPALA